LDADAKPVTQSVYAIDCEMVPAPDCVLGYRVLTKTNTVSVPHQGRQGADSSLRQARSYDQLVKPPSPITDYLSFSGITAQALEPMTTTLADVQTHLQALISPHVQPNVSASAINRARQIRASPQSPDPLQAPPRHLYVLPSWLVLTPRFHARRQDFHGQRSWCVCRHRNDYVIANA